MTYNSEQGEHSRARNGTTVYDAALDELRTVADDDGTRRRIESGVLRESRGNDVLHLHTTLKAIDVSHTDVVEGIGSVQRALNDRADRLTDRVDDAERAVTSNLADLRSEVNTRFDRTWDTLNSNFDKTWGSMGQNFDKTWDTMGQNFDKTWDSMGQNFDKTWEAIGQNFDATNERTKREIHDLRQELTAVLDRRFTHIDQTFASIRADIEVLKALQMELIKERIGRPDVIKR